MSSNKSESENRDLKFETRDVGNWRLKNKISIQKQNNVGSET